MKKAYTLDHDEAQILQDIENDVYVSVTDADQARQQAQSLAKNTLVKNKNINIRLSAHDIERLKAKAMQNGIPYQTLITSILHQYVNDRLDVRL